MNPLTEPSSSFHDALDTVASTSAGRPLQGALAAYLKAHTPEAFPSTHQLAPPHLDFVAAIQPVEMIAQVADDPPLPPKPLPRPRAVSSIQGLDREHSSRQRLVYPVASRSVNPVGSSHSASPFGTYSDSSANTTFKSVQLPHSDYKLSMLAKNRAKVHAFRAHEQATRQLKVNHSMA